MKTHWSIKKSEKYHTSIHWVYNIIQAKTRDIISQNVILHIALKAINNTADSNASVLTLLVFSAYSRIITYCLSSTS